MVLARQTVALLESARQLAGSLQADAVLLLTETDLDWTSVREHLGDCKLLVAAEDRELNEQFKTNPTLAVLDIASSEATTQERISLALLEAVRTEQVRHGADVIVLYNGVEASGDAPEPVDSLSVIHLGEHLERLDYRDLRRLGTQVPLDTLKAVVGLALAIGREGREGHPVGTMFVVGDTRKVLSMCRPMNFNPFRGYCQADRNIKVRAVREQIKDIAQLEGAIIIRREGIAVAACMRVEAPTSGISVSMGLGTRHAAAAAISACTKAVAIAVSQSSGSVRLFQNGEMVLHIEPFDRPLIFGPVQLDGESTITQKGYRHHLFVPSVAD
jgi:DNA integrity scanning protein DisA with diadenylate cyclase activity